MVEIIPKKQKIVLPEWHWPLRFSVVLCFISIIAFIGLKVYLFKVQEEIVSINNDIKVEAGKVNPDDENTVLHLRDSLDAFSGLVANHSYFSNVLETIGSLTYQKVVFTKFDATRKDQSIQLRGLAQNYTALAKQMVALRENDNIKSLDVKGINFSDRGLEFEISLIADPKIFIKSK